MPLTPIFVRLLLIVGTSTPASYHPASLDQILCLVTMLFVFLFVIFSTFDLFSIVFSLFSTVPVVMISSRQGRHFVGTVSPDDKLTLPTIKNRTILMLLSLSR